MQQTPVTIAEPPVPKEPPPEFEFLADPPTISALDLYVFWNWKLRLIYHYQLQYIAPWKDTIIQDLGVEIFYPN